MRPRAHRDPATKSPLLRALRQAMRLPLFLAVFLLISGLLAAVPAQARYAAIVIDADTGRVYHSVNADTRNYPASLTKMMTLYMVFDALKAKRLRLDQKLSVSKRAAGQPASKLGLTRRDTITVRDAILALVTKSANDVATVVAEALGGTESKFARAMTRRAQELGMTRTSFRNASGLPNRRQMSTARDMATLSRALLRDHGAYYRYFSARSYTHKGRKHRNHNKLLGSYRGTDGIKTGYIRASGFNLAASVKRGNTRLIGVVFGGRSAKSRDLHMKRLLDKAFAARSGTPMARATPAPRRNSQAAMVLPRRKPPVASSIRPAPPPTRSARTVPAANGDWAVQVGAYRHHALAQGAITKVRSTIPHLVAGSRGIIVPRQGQRGSLFRARLVGLSKKDAYRACAALKRRDHPCMTMRRRIEEENLALRFSGAEAPPEAGGSLERAPAR